jgi:hypothetical protein
MGDPGARSTNRKIIKLMKKSVGIANSNLRRVKVSMTCDAFVQKG